MLFRCKTQEEVSFVETYKSTMRGNTNYLQPIQKRGTGSSEDSVRMCCCQAESNYHSENQKFMLFGSEEEIIKPIFPDLKTRPTADKPTILLTEPHCNMSYWQKSDDLYLYDRNIEIHKIVEKLTENDTKRLVYV